MAIGRVYCQVLHPGSTAYLLAPVTLFTPSIPCFPHLSNADDKSTFLRGWL